MNLHRVVSEGLLVLPDKGYLRLPMKPLWHQPNGFCDNNGLFHVGKRSLLKLLISSYLACKPCC